MKAHLSSILGVLLFVAVFFGACFLVALAPSALFGSERVYERARVDARQWLRRVNPGAVLVEVPRCEWSEGFPVYCTVRLGFEEHRLRCAATRFRNAKRRCTWLSTRDRVGEWP